MARWYPYDGYQQECRFNKLKPMGAKRVKGWELIPAGDEQALMAAVASQGPISVAINVTDTFMDYASGVLDDQLCWNEWEHLNHGTRENANCQQFQAVLVVGYGTDPQGGDYWLVKNSWGTKWGEKGKF